MEQERMQAFWEKCGLVKIKRGWKYPDGDVLIDTDPQVDLNSLFRYGYTKIPNDKKYATLFYWIGRVTEGEDPAESFFLVLDQVL